MTRLNVSEVRDGFAEAINRVAYRGERIVVHRRDRALAALVPVEDLRLLEQIEDRIDIDEARRALAEPGTVSWEDLKAELGL